MLKDSELDDFISEMKERFKSDRQSKGIWLDEDIISGSDEKEMIKKLAEANFQGKQKEHKIKKFIGPRYDDIVFSISQINNRFFYSKTSADLSSSIEEPEVPSRPQRMASNEASRFLEIADRHFNRKMYQKAAENYLLFAEESEFCDE